MEMGKCRLHAFFRFDDRITKDLLKRVDRAEIGGGRTIQGAERRV
jgi:hypothetical protein